jgi:hypothetical protein
MLSGYEHFQNTTYLEAAIRAGEWLAQIQNPKGFWDQHVYMNQVRVYDTYVAAPLASLYTCTKRNDFKSTAEKHCHWVVTEKLKTNGWPEDADNTIKHNDRPILHTIAYTFKGLTESALLLGQNEWIEAVIPPSRILAEKFRENGTLNGRFNSKWEGSEAFITTGGAQIANVWLDIYSSTRDKFWLESAEKMAAYLCTLQNDYPNYPEIHGALFGSYPLWGQYEPFACPNWGTKYFAELLMRLNDQRE